LSEKYTYFLDEKTHPRNEISVIGVIEMIKAVGS